MAEFRPLVNPGAKALIVGEAPGAEEERKGYPFVGSSGQELDMILADAGLSRGDFSLTNVFFDRPPDNDLNAWATPRKGIAPDPRLPWAAIPCKKGVVDPAHTQPALARLAGEIEQLAPNLIVALGNTPLAALTGISGISKVRGTIHLTSTPGLPQGVKVLPSFHPAFILRNYESRPLVVADFMKAKDERHFPGTRFKKRKIYIEPSLGDIFEWQKILLSAKEISLDIETKARQITCIGFAPDIHNSYVVPFWFNNQNYWRSPFEEKLAYKMVRTVCMGPAVKIAQNGMYDLFYLHKYGIPVNNFQHDTMIAHHSLYPHLPKSLAVLGSIYASERSWKSWRNRPGDVDDFKKEA